MKIVLLGKNGQLGWELERTLAPLGEITALGPRDLDLADSDALVRTVRHVRPEVIINAAAYTAVDQAESELEKAYAINAQAPGVLSEISTAMEATLIHFSTDYVFDGEKGAPYIETDEPNPLNVYGRSKLAGEQAVTSAGGSYLILRTAWVYATRRASFVTKVLEWARQQETLRIVDDQFSNPTWAGQLAEVTALILARGKDYISERRGLYHLAGTGFVSRFDWAQEILRLDPHPQEQVCRQLLPAITAEFPAPATRPFFSALACEKFRSIFGLQLPEWKHSLQLAMGEGHASAHG